MWPPPAPAPAPAPSSGPSHVVSTDPDNISVESEEIKIEECTDDQLVDKILKYKGSSEKDLADLKNSQSRGDTSGRVFTLDFAKPEDQPYINRLFELNKGLDTEGNPLTGSRAVTKKIKAIFRRGEEGGASKKEVLGRRRNVYRAMDGKAFPLLGIALISALAAGILLIDRKTWHWSALATAICVASIWKIPTFIKAHKEVKDKEKDSGIAFKHCIVLDPKPGKYGALENVPQLQVHSSWVKVSSKPLKPEDRPQALAYINLKGTDKFQYASSSLDDVDV